MALLALTAAGVTLLPPGSGGWSWPNAGSKGLLPVMEVPYGTFCNNSAVNTFALPVLRPTVLNPYFPAATVGDRLVTGLQQHRTLWSQWGGLSHAAGPSERLAYAGPMAGEGWDREGRGVIGWGGIG